MSASPCIFLTGATGFVGGTILTSIAKAHPNARIMALVRKDTDAPKLQVAYPNLTPIIGDLSQLSLLTSSAADADFVVHAAGHNGEAVCAMIDGLASRATPTAPDGTLPPRLISVTGPRSLIDLSKPITGGLAPDSHPWSDVADEHAIMNVPADRMNAASERAIIARSVEKRVGTVLLSSCQLWGRGLGHFHRESAAALYYQAVKKRGRAFVIGDGTATWSWTAIGDLGDAAAFVVGRALMGAGGVGVNGEGYHFVSTGDLSMMERARTITKRLGLGEVESLSVQEAKGIHPFGHIFWGCGERARSDKLARLGWTPKQTDWRALMEEHGGERA